MYHETIFTIDYKYRDTQMSTFFQTNKGTSKSDNMRVFEVGKLLGHKMIGNIFNI